MVKLRQIQKVLLLGFVLLINARCFRVNRKELSLYVKINKSGAPCFLFAKQGIQDATLKLDGGETKVR